GGWWRRSRRSIVLRRRSGGRRRRLTGITSKGQRDDVVCGEGLDFAIDFKAQDGLRPAQILALQHAAIFQLERVGQAWSGQPHHGAPCEKRPLQILQVEFPSPFGSYQPNSINPSLP